MGAPEYVMLGGLVFTKLTIPLINQSLGGNVFMPGRVIQAAVEKWKSGSEEVVVLLRQMRHVVNLGYDCSSVRVLHRFNGEPVHTLAGLAKMAAAALDDPAPSPCQVIRFGFKDDPEDVDAVVLKAPQVREADKEICEKNKISKPQHLAEEGPSTRKAASAMSTVQKDSLSTLAARTEDFRNPSVDRLRETIKPSAPSSFRLKAAGSFCFQDQASPGAAAFSRIRAQDGMHRSECQGLSCGVRGKSSAMDMAVLRASQLRKAGSSICEDRRMAKLL